MKVRELLELLKGAPQDSVVLFMDEYADVDETDEIRQVDIQPTPWTHETGRYNGEAFEVRYPGPPDSRAETGYGDIVHVAESVVILSSGPTNLRFR